MDGFIAVVPYCQTSDRNTGVMYNAPGSSWVGLSSNSFAQYFTIVSLIVFK